MFWRKPAVPVPAAGAVSDAWPEAAAVVPPSADRCVYLGRDRLLVRAAWGGWMVVPTFKVDVTIGVVRDGLIEPWTTRLVQELLQPGHTYINAGANFGYYPVLAGHIVGAEGQVIAVDANPHILPYLLLTREWSGLSYLMRIHWRALWNKSGEDMIFHFNPQYLGGGQAESVGTVHPEYVPCANWTDLIWSAAAVQNAVMPDGQIYKSPLAKFTARTTTIDELVPDGRAVDLIHLDVEGSEAIALLGARDVIARSPQLRLITEWSAQHYQRGGRARDAFHELWGVLQARDFRVRQVLPKIAASGGLHVSYPLDFDFMTQRAEHGEYVWVRAGQDPWEALTGGTPLEIKR